jgi:hypothetical protein
MTIETMKLALEALEAHADIGIKSDKAITALRTAIAEADKQEPVAFNRKAVWNVLFEVWNQNISASEGLQKLQDLYTTPPAAPGYIKGDTRSGLVDNDFEENT